MKTKVIRWVSNRGFYLYSMRLSSQGNSIVWKRRQSPIAVKAYSYFDREYKGEELAEQYNAVYAGYKKAWWKTLGLTYDSFPVHNRKVDIEDPLKFLLICMQLQKEQNDENQSRLNKKD